MNGRYILNKRRKVVPCPDLMTWARWYELPKNRRVALTQVTPAVKVSTVFLALDHAFKPGDAPILWESMVFVRKSKKGLDELHAQCRRCSGNWEQAEAMHEEMCAWVKDYLHEQNKKVTHRSRKGSPPGLH